MPKDKEIALPHNINLNPSAWSYKEYLNFAVLVQTDVTKAYALAMKVIRSWDYNVPITAPNALMKLETYQSAEVLRTINDVIETALDSMSIHDVTVDFRRGKWTMENIMRFQEAVQAGDYPLVRDMAWQVCVVEGLEMGSELPLVEGAMMVKAIRERHLAVMQGKD